MGIEDKDRYRPVKASIQNWMALVLIIIFFKK